MAARDEAHNLLGQMGCEVETVQNATEGCDAAETITTMLYSLTFGCRMQTGMSVSVWLREINSHVPVL